MDSDTHELISIQTGERFPRQRNVVIGEHCWIGNGVNINKGTTLPPNTVVASHSLLNKDYTSVGAHCVLAGIPAKVVKENIKWSL